MTNENMYEKLSEPFPQEMERTVQKSGTRLTYLPVSEIINRMNRIFGPTGWSHEVISCVRDATDTDWVVAHVRVTTIDKESREKWTMNHHDGFGGVRIKRTKAGDIVDLGDEFKGAVSDALKKACQHLGVGLYLARDVEAIEADEAMHAAPSVVVPSAQREKYEHFMSVRGRLNEEGLSKLREYWVSYSGNRPVPKPAEFTEKELDDLTTEVLRIEFDGTTISRVDGDSE
jgi:hypothetical protein